MGHVSISYIFLSDGIKLYVLLLHTYLILRLHWLRNEGPLGMRLLRMSWKHLKVLLLLL